MPANEADCTNPVDYIVRAMDLETDPSEQTLKEILENAPIDEAWIDAVLPDRLPADTYDRKVLHGSADFELVLATWPAGVGTLVHDHGRLDSHGMVRVLRGRIANRLFRREGAENVRFVQEQVFKPGDYLPVPKGLLHAMKNKTSELAASLHLYSPHILDVSYWDPETCKPVVCNV